MHFLLSYFRTYIDAIKSATVPASHRRRRHPRHVCAAAGAEDQRPKSWIWNVPSHSNSSRSLTKQRELAKRAGGRIKHYSEKARRHTGTGRWWRQYTRPFAAAATTKPGLPDHEGTGEGGLVPSNFWWYVKPGHNKPIKLACPHQDLWHSHTPYYRVLLPVHTPTPPHRAAVPPAFLPT